MKILYTDARNANLTPVFEQLRAAGHEPAMANPMIVSEQEVIEQGQGAEVLVGGLAQFSRKVMVALPKLRMICAPQVGTDHIDLVAAKELGIWVVNSPLSNVTEVACQTLTMALMSVRKIMLMDTHVRAGGWDYNAGGVLRRPGLLTVGIVGVGNIGQAFAQRAATCFGRLYGYDPYLPKQCWPDNVNQLNGLHEMLSMCDLVTMHVPLTDETRGMANAEFFAAMRQDAHFINAARGPIVDTTALIDALDSGHLEGAALDVLPQEPPDKNDPVLQHTRIILTPHSAFYSKESQQGKHIATVENILALANAGRPVHTVVEGRIKRESLS